MKPRMIQQVIPALIMTGAAAVPIVTTVEILRHVPGGGVTTALQPSASVVMAPPRTPARTAGLSAPASSGGMHSYPGPVVKDPFGGVQAILTITGKKISDVAISAPQGNPTSASINQQAVPLLRSETLQAQSAHINSVSGATYTSQAYAKSLQAALDRARSQGNAPAVAPSSSQVASGAPAGTANAQSLSVSTDD